MAMNGSDMGDEIWDAIKATTGVPYSPANEARARAIWEAVGIAIVNHITSNAQVNPSSLAFNPVQIIAPEHAGPCSGSGAITTGTGTVI